MQCLHKISMLGFGGDAITAITANNQRWLSAALFVDGLEPILGGHN